MKISKELKTGSIVIAALAGFWWMFQFFKGKNIFSNEKVYYVLYDNVNGLEETKPVTINGLRVGRVAKIIAKTRSDKHIYFVIKLEIKDQFTLSKNTIAEIYEPGFMSGKEIKLNLAYDTSIAQSGDTLKGKLNPSLTSVLSDEVKPMKNKANSIMDKLDTTLASTNKLLDLRNRQNITLLIENLNATILEFKKTAQTTNALMNANNGKLGLVLDNANTVMSTTHKTVEKYGTVADKMQQLKLEQSLANLDNSLKNLNELTNKLNNNTGTMGKMMNDPALYNNLTQTTKSLNALLIDFKENPKNYVHFSVFGRKNKSTPIADSLK